MRGFQFAVVLVTIVSSSLGFAQTNTFLDKCLGQTGVIQKKLVCAVNSPDNKSVLNFVLDQGQDMKVYATGQFGSFNKSIPVNVITHLPPRITELGVVGESAEFAAKDSGLFGNTLALITIPCGQAAYAAIGVEKVTGDQEPDQIVANCQVQ